MMPPRRRRRAEARREARAERGRGDRRDGAHDGVREGGVLRVTRERRRRRVDARALECNGRSASSATRARSAAAAVVRSSHCCDDDADARPRPLSVWKYPRKRECSGARARVRRRHNDPRVASRARGGACIREDRARVVASSARASKSSHREAGATEGAPFLAIKFIVLAADYNPPPSRTFRDRTKPATER
jgi:hypothetical protein